MFVAVSSNVISEQITIEPKESYIITTHAHDLVEFSGVTSSNHVDVYVYFHGACSSSLNSEFIPDIKGDDLPDKGNVSKKVDPDDFGQTMNCLDRGYT